LDRLAKLTHGRADRRLRDLAEADQEGGGPPVGPIQNSPIVVRSMRRAWVSSKDRSLVLFVRDSAIEDAIAPARGPAVPAGY
jgi:hypothetical protein